MGSLRPIRFRVARTIGAFPGELGIGGASVYGLAMDLRLPPALRAALDAARALTPSRAIAERSAAMSDLYRRNEPSSRAIRSAEDAVAYAITRMPATYAAAMDVLGRLAQAHPDFAPTSALDLGAGPGAGAWAASETWPALASATLLDHNEAFLALAKSLAQRADAPAIRTARIEREDLAKPLLAKPLAAQRHDLVVASYALTEIADVEAAAVRWLALASHALVIIEPGRPRDYGRLMKARRALIAAGGRILAPCPHANACPLTPEDWCHFSARLPRLREHMRAKGASLPFEDEKFSYLVVAPPGSALAPIGASRVLAPPHVGKPGAVLKLCTTVGVELRNVPSRDKAAFKRAKKAEWGDVVY